METVIEESKIRKVLPQSYPFLMIDKIIEFQKREGDSPQKGTGRDK